MHIKSFDDTFQSSQAFTQLQTHPSVRPLAPKQIQEEIAGNFLALMEVRYANISEL